MQMFHADVATLLINNANFGLSSSTIVCWIDIATISANQNGGLPRPFGPYFANDFRLSAISVKSNFWGSANFWIPSSIKTDSSRL